MLLNLSSFSFPSSPISSLLPRLPLSLPSFFPSLCPSLPLPSFSPSVPPFLPLSLPPSSHPFLYISGQFTSLNPPSLLLSLSHSHSLTVSLSQSPPPPLPFSPLSLLVPHPPPPSPQINSDLWAYHYTKPSAPQDVVGVSCSWCLDSFHVGCFSESLRQQPCHMGPLRNLIIPPSWIVRVPPVEQVRGQDSRSKFGKYGAWGQSSIVFTTFLIGLKPTGENLDFYINLHLGHVQYVFTTSGP